MKKSTYSAFTLIELLVGIIIVIIIILWISKIDFNKIWDKQELDKKIIQIISQIETIRNNSLLWKWIWTNLNVPEKYEVHFWNTWSWNIKIYYNTWWTDTEYILDKKITFWNNYEYISKLNCMKANTARDIVQDEDSDDDIKNWTWIIIFNWWNVSLSWACDDPLAKVFQVEVTKKTFKRKFQINTINWLIEIVK